LLLDSVTVALCAVICGADGWVAVATFGRAKAAWLHTFLALPGDIPAHDTFGRVFGHLNPAECRANGKGAPHLVRAWACGSGLVPGQLAVADKSNEITALPALLRLLNVTDATIT
jgi:hypothetical protein